NPTFKIQNCLRHPHAVNPRPAFFTLRLFHSYMSQRKTDTLYEQLSTGRTQGVFAVGTGDVAFIDVFQARFQPDFACPPQCAKRSPWLVEEFIGWIELAHMPWDRRIDRLYKLSGKGEKII